MDNAKAKKIDCMIVGAQKAATSPFAHYLSQHPSVYKHIDSEFTYFVMDEKYKDGYDKAFKSSYSKYNEEKIILGKSVTVMQSKQSLERLFDHNPNMLVIILLRNPIDRAYSSYWYARRRGWENIKTFEEAIEIEGKRRFDNIIFERNTNYIKNSMYFNQLTNIFSIFPSKNINVFLNEDLKNNSKNICNNIFQKLNLDKFENINTDQIINASKKPIFSFIPNYLDNKSILKENLKKILPSFIFLKLHRIKNFIVNLNEKNFSKPLLSGKTRVKLFEIFKDDINKIEKLIKRDLSHWK